MLSKMRSILLAWGFGVALFIFVAVARGVDAPKQADAGPFDKLDRQRISPIDARSVPDIAVAVATQEDMEVVSCQLSSDGKMITIGATGGAVLWDLTGAEPKQIQTLVEPIVQNWMRGVAFTPDGKRLAANVAGKLRMWDITADGANPVKLEKISGGESLAFSADGKMLMSRTYISGTWFKVTAKGVIEVPGLINGAYDDYHFSPDGKMFAAIYVEISARNGRLYGSEVMLWKLGAGRATQHNVLQLDNSIKAMAVSRDWKWFATGSLDNKVRIWDMSGKTPSVKFTMDSPRWTKKLSFTPDGAHLVGVDSGNDILLYDAAAGKLQKSWKFTPRQGSDFATGASYLLFSSASISPDGRHVAFTNRTSKTTILRLPIPAVKNE